MILCISRGQLGNQIFRYMFIKSIMKNNEKIIVSGFEDLIRVFEISDIVNIKKKNKIINAFMERIIQRSLKFLGSIRIINKIELPFEFINGKDRESRVYTETIGLFKNIKFISRGYFQSETFFDKKVTEHFKVKSEFDVAADDFMKDIPIHYHKIFVHIRRGDYKTFKIWGKSALLPVNYYKKLIDYFLNEIENPFFIFLSDEPDFAEKEFSYIKNKKISRNTNPGTDFAIITKCTSGILSTSTFSWWAAYHLCTLQS